MARPEYFGRHRAEKTAEKKFAKAKTVVRQWSRRSAAIVSSFTALAALSFPGDPVFPSKADTAPGIHSVASAQLTSYESKATTVKASLPHEAKVSTPVYPALQVESALRKKIQSDDIQSVKLPNGTVLWTFGDVTQVNHRNTVFGATYPHSAFVEQKPNTMQFNVVPGRFTEGIQQVPNWNDKEGSYFWPATPIVDGNTLDVLGQRVSGGKDFKITGEFMAQFDISGNTLTYEGITQIPQGSNKSEWGGALIDQKAGGWWITGSHNVPCQDYTNCKVGDLAFVPFGEMSNPSKWKIFNNIIPASDNIGETLAPIRTQNGITLFTKGGDKEGGKNILRLSAQSMTGPWGITGSWNAPVPENSKAYAVAVHPEQGAPIGEEMVTYAVSLADSHVNYPAVTYLPTDTTQNAKNAVILSRRAHSVINKTGIMV